MSGHNKWSQIKHKKGVTDAKKSQLFSKLARFLTVEAKIAKGNTNSPSLRAAIEKARKANMPLDNIERAIKRASDTGAQMESITYEAYGPGGVGIIIETLTDNRNRTAPEIKHILSKNEASLAGIGSVKWAFVKDPSTSSGQVWLAATTVSLSDEELQKLDKLVDELEENDDIQEVYTNAE
ncbi:MAG: transcriptional regulator [Candidatus Nomurabacteria bacterium GW2011_GWB1_37_5]|uniref:Transcriptional regulator n=1 Tax=Candidatus Nomurabacteria bacterium GW2011_GWB1_37_5 TaxID=1618742 RepID=A0A0G0JGJ1_9BACT|nr:MAG: transcriptional regulator [Candidatus Nomurabacteria bacterium GW2011_GWB1_37_5]